MTDNTGENLNQTDEELKGTSDETKVVLSPAATPEEIQEMVQKLVAEQLAPMKQNVGKAYEERDKAAKELAQLRANAKAAEIQRLQDEGKEAEALKMQLAELQGQLEATKEINTKLSRDQLVDNALAGLSFKSEYAKRVAKADLIAELVQSADGQWVHKTGASVNDAVDMFSKDADKQILFVPKNSTGASTISTGTGSTVVDNKAPFMTKPVGELTADEMIQAQLAGRFGAVPTSMFG